MEEFIKEEIEKYGQNKINEAGIIFLENKREIKTLSDLVNYFCCVTECKNCPVVINNFEKRTKYEKECLNTLCVDNLYKWVIQETKLVKEID